MPDLERVVFEYTDDAGAAHRVSSIQEVPKKYLRTTMSSMEAASPAWSPSLRDSPSAAWLAAAALALVFYRSRNFLVRVLIVCGAAGWLIMKGYSRFMSSPYARTSETPQAQRAR